MHNDIYITGHRNPDLDSVCSAYAYAELKNKIDKDNHYIPVRCGHLSDSILRIIDTLKLKDIPVYMRDVFPKISDVLLLSKAYIEADSPISDIASSYEKDDPPVIPVFEKGEFYGLLSTDDISHWYLRTLKEKGAVDRVPTVREIMSSQEEPVFKDELYEDAKKMLSSSKKRGLAVFDEKGYMGYVSRRCFLETPRYNLILVDHNEPKQSIMGIETANIVEIIDHHRLDSVKTDLPIFIDAEPVGSTCTIVYQLFKRNGLVPEENTARMLLCGITADTLILKSPTTTAIDVSSAEELTKMLNTDLYEFGLSMFASVKGLKERDPLKAVESDFKSYNDKGVKFGIGQCEVTTLGDINEYRDIYLEALDEVKKQNGLDWAVLMITDVLKEHSLLLCTAYKGNKHLSYEKISEFVFDMPGVMSRKKQLLPEIIHAINV
ncbi:MAG: DHH family phosphoesterase [Lachnospiraceae bacterium]|nr:DHH family phosphoesterase [Lachnospiraceae bacterium]